MSSQTTTPIRFNTKPLQFDKSTPFNNSPALINTPIFVKKSSVSSFNSTPAGLKLSLKTTPVDAVNTPKVVRQTFNKENISFKSGNGFDSSPISSSGLNNTPAFALKKSSSNDKQFKTPLKPSNLFTGQSPAVIKDYDSPAWIKRKDFKSKFETITFGEEISRQVNQIASKQINLSTDAVECAMRRLSLSAEKRRDAPGSIRKSSKKNPLLNTPTAWHHSKSSRRVQNLNAQDRFISARSQEDTQTSSFLLNKTQRSNGDDMSLTIKYTSSVSKSINTNSMTLNSTDFAYQSELAKACGVALDQRILSFKKKPNSTGGKDLRQKYLSKGLQDKLINARRKIPTVPEKVLDAPGILDDYYCNVLDWSSQNVLAVSLGPTVYLWNATSGETSELYTVDDEESISSLSWAADGVHLAVGDFKGNTHLLNSESQRRVRILQTQQSQNPNQLMAEGLSRVGSLCWNKTTLTSGTNNGSIYHFDVRLPRPLKAQSLQTHNGEVCGLKWSHDGKYLASGGNDNQLQIWDVNNLQKAKFVKQDHVGAVKALSWCPWQSGLLASGGGVVDKKINFWNFQTDKKEGFIDTGSQVTSLHWSKNYKEIVSSQGFSDDPEQVQNQLIVWKYPTMKKVVELTQAHESRILHSSLSPDGQTLCTGASDENLKFWKLFAFDPKNVKTRSTSHTSTSIVNVNNSPDFGTSNFRQIF